MKLILTFTNRLMSMDFLVNSDIQIKEALFIITENTDFKLEKKPNFIFSKRRDQKINVMYSFEQADIYSGDKLIVEELKDE